MTEAESLLVNLVNNRRIQVGKEPLRASHIQRVIRLTCGRAPKVMAPLINPGGWQWSLRIPYVLTPKALAALAGGVEP